MTLPVSSLCPLPLVNTLHHSAAWLVDETERLPVSSCSPLQIYLALRYILNGIGGG